MIGIESEVDRHLAEEEAEQKRYEEDFKYYRAEAEEDYKCTYEALQMEELSAIEQSVLHNVMKVFSYENAAILYTLIRKMVEKHRDSDADSDATLKPRS